MTSLNQILRLYLSVEPVNEARSQSRWTSSESADLCSDDYSGFSIPKFWFKILKLNLKYAIEGVEKNHFKSSV